MGAQSTNPFRNMMNQLVMEKGRQGQQMPGFMQIDPNQAQLTDVMRMMDQTWADSRVMEQKQREMMMANAMHMEQAYAQSRMAEEEMMMRHVAMNAEWQGAMELQMANDWRSDFIQNEVMQSKAHMLEGAFTEAEQKVNAKEQVDTENTENLMSLMQSDPDPRFQNSKFLKFLHSVKTGEFELDEKNNELKVHPEKHVPMQSALNGMEDAFRHAEARETEMSESRLR